MTEGNVRLPTTGEQRNLTLYQKVDAIQWAKINAANSTLGILGED